MLKSELAELARRRMTDKPPTIFDARRMVRPYLHQWVRFTMDDGHRPGSAYECVLHDVLDLGEDRLALRVGRLRPVGVVEGAERRTTIPVAQVRTLPDGLRFLSRPRSEWPLPPAVARCRCGREVSGRFCPDCGRLVRRDGDDSPLFRAEQEVLRGAGAGVEHLCGAIALVDSEAVYCGKCGKPLEKKL